MGMWHKRNVFYSQCRSGIPAHWRWEPGAQEAKITLDCSTSFGASLYFSGFFLQSNGVWRGGGGRVLGDQAFKKSEEEIVHKSLERVETYRW